MPYIKSKQRCAVRAAFDEMSLDWRALSSGELNYVLTQLCINYLGGNKESYAAYNEVIGVLECAKLELYRRRVAKYEDKKIEENGDVY